MITELALYIGSLLLLVGALFVLLASIGVLRLPDLYTRMHAASKAGVVGAGLILLAIALVCFDAAVALRALIAILFLVLTTPVSAHLLARAAHRTRYKPSELTISNELDGGNNSQHPN